VRASTHSEISGVGCLRGMTFGGRTIWFNWVGGYQGTLGKNTGRNEMGKVGPGEMGNWGVAQ